MDINDDVFVYLMEKETLSNFNQHNDMMIYEMYKNQEGGSPIFNEYGAWFEEAEIFEHTDLDKYMRRRNLQVRITSPTGTSSHLRTMLPESSSRPLPAQQPNHAT